jgi:hypothetical protein
MSKMPEICKWKLFERLEYTEEKKEKNPCGREKRMWARPNFFTWPKLSWLKSMSHELFPSFAYHVCT